jgi:hypothetical protein
MNSILVEHPLRSTKFVNLALISTFLVNQDLMELECLGYFLQVKLFLVDLSWWSCPEQALTWPSV